MRNGSMSVSDCRTMLARYCRRRSTSKCGPKRETLPLLCHFRPLLHNLPPGCYLHSRTQVPIIMARVLTAVYRYSRADLLRILRLVPRQLQTWEKAGLVTTGEDYSFFDLVQIKKVRDLCAQRVRPAVIRQSLEAMQKQVAGMENPLLEAGAYRSGRRIAFRHQGRLLEPIAGQFMFDFSSEESK